MANFERRLAIARCALGAMIMLWAGVLIGVSFLAAPAKFNAPGLSLPVAMQIGRQEFGALNRARRSLLPWRAWRSPPTRGRTARSGSASASPRQSYSCNGSGCCRRWMPAPS
jgi:hypothetical protein